MKNFELIGKYEGDRFRFDNANGSCVVIGSIRLANGSARVVRDLGMDPEDSITVKGEADADELERNGTYRFLGHFREYHNRRTDVKEQQFCFRTFVPHVPHDLEGLVNYLVLSGTGNGIGPAKARMLIKHFGCDGVLEACRTQPEEVAKLTRVKLNLAESFAERLREKQAVEVATLEVDRLLTGRGFPKSLGRQCIREWGNKAATTIEEDPYQLMNFRGVGFKLADKLYIELGKDPLSIDRQALCLWYGIASDMEGHTWFPAPEAVSRLHRSIGATGIDFKAAIVRAREYGQISEDHYGALASIRSDGTDGVLTDDGSNLWLAEGKYAAAEERLADYVVKALHEPEFSLWPDVDQIEKIDDHQRGELRMALQGRVAILGGSPGTGKTFTVSQLVRAMLASGEVGLDEIGIAAPTGKACVRLTELLQAAGIETTARTWHSLLGVGEQTETGGWAFRHGPGNPLPFKVLIGDESSMLDLPLMRSIFAARMPGAHVLMVGDINQLPPVGNGAPLRDMIQAGIAYGELTEIKRNSGGIVEACAAMRDQQPWLSMTQADDTNLISVPSSKSGMLDALRREIESVRDAMGIDAVWDCQVLVAVNERSDLGRKPVNEFLQNALNPSPKVGNLRFRERDKVVCLKNGWYESVLHVDVGDEIDTNDRGEVYVANGELGSVERIVDEKFLIVQLSSPHRMVKVPLFRQKSDDQSESGGAANWDLGYALSVHKSQGSEWPVVFVLLDEYPGARMVCDRAWIYTAVSRAKQKCFLMGDLRLAQQFCRVQKMQKRKTFLRERICLSMFEREALLL